METDSITSTEFQKRAGQYIDASAKNPIFITRHNRPVRVLIDIDLYERFIEYEKSTQEAHSPETATQDHLDVILASTPGAGSKAASAELGDDSDLKL